MKLWDKLLVRRAISICNTQISFEPSTQRRIHDTTWSDEAIVPRMLSRRSDGQFLMLDNRVRRQGIINHVE
jgi:hypothetical protein